MTLKQKTCDEIKQIFHDRNLINYNLSHITNLTIKDKTEFNRFTNLFSRIKIF